MLPDPITAVADIPLSDEVRDFCWRHDLLHHLNRAVELARQYFSIVGDPVVKLEQDPEEGEWYLVLEIRVEGDESECARGDREYLRSWANSTPWPAVHLIQLSYDLAPESIRPIS
jgi:hypothetical protein